MKKQILFLAFLITVLFTGMKSYGQNAEVPYLDGAPTCTSAVTLGCADGDELHPMPGVTYNYAVTASSSNVVHWFVTDDADVWLAGAIAAAVDPDGGTGSYILDAEDGVYNQGTSAATPNTLLDIDISWKSFDGTTNQVILVAYVTDAAGCTDNIQVWRIEPQYNFTLDIAGLLDAGTAGDEECVSPIVSANYDGTNLTMDHGVNYVFFSVNAANWQTEWKPTFTIDPSTTATIASSVVGVQWAYPNESFGASPVWHDATDNVQASHYEGTESVNGFVGSAGACIVLKVEVDHTTATVQNELLADQTVIIGVDGEMIDPQTGTYTSTYLDKDEGAAPTDPCVTNHTDEGTYTITARPTIIESNPTTVDGPFEPKD